MTKAEEFLLLLEAERNDLSYRKPVVEPAKAVVVTLKPESVAARKRRDETFFDGGRYQMGARDKRAVAAWKRLNKNV